MRNRLLLAAVSFAAACGLAYAQPIWGPEPAGTAPKHPPVLTGAVVQASPNSSPIPAGRTVPFAVDSYGRLMTVSSGGSSSGNVTLQPGTAAANVTLPAASPVPVQTIAGTALNATLGGVTSGGAVNVSVPAGAAAINVTLPAASPVPVLVAPSPIVIAAGTAAQNVTLPSASPVPVMANAYATATGYSTYCSPSFSGGSSEVTIKGSGGVLVGLSVSNPNTTDVYVEAWDNSNPAPGTTAPDLCFCVPGGSGSSNRGTYDLVLPAPGWAFATAMTFTAVTAANGSSTPGSAVTVTLVYK